MQNVIKQIAGMLVEMVCGFAKAQVACATGIISYQPEVPEAMLEGETNNDQL